MGAIANSARYVARRRRSSRRFDLRGASPARANHALRPEITPGLSDIRGLHESTTHHMNSRSIRGLPNHRPVDALPGAERRPPAFCAPHSLILGLGAAAGRCRAGGSPGGAPGRRRAFPPCFPPFEPSLAFFGTIFQKPSPPPARPGRPCNASQTSADCRSAPVAPWSERRPEKLCSASWRGYAAPHPLANRPSAECVCSPHAKSTFGMSPALGIALPTRHFFEMGLPSLQT